MPLTEKTERALEACHDAILAPTRWPWALQSLAESFGAASCTFYEHDREKSPGPVPMSVATMVKALMLQTEFNAMKQRLKLPPALPNDEAVYEGAFNPKPVERRKRRFGSCR